MLKCMVLLAEDFDDARELYRLALEKAGFAVHDLASGDVVMPLALELQPDVVVLDLVLPGLDGLAVAQHLRAHPLTARVPIVVLSAHAFPEDEARAREAGADAFLRKPCLPDELVATLVRVSETCREKHEDGEAGRTPVAL
jgi:DNA-binding response OmpR family regulator